MSNQTGDHSPNVSGIVAAEVFAIGGVLRAQRARISPERR
jgi:hypothetical protein